MRTILIFLIGFVFGVFYGLNKEFTITLNYNSDEEDNK